MWQPFASLFAAGVKLHHTPDWQTDYRGPVAIHAAKTIDVAGAPDRLCTAALGRHWRHIVPIGMIVAVGRLTGCYQAHRLGKLTLADSEAGEFTEDRYAWRFAELRALDRPIPAAGRQRVWNWTPPHDLEDRLGPILDHPAACRYLGWA